MYLTVIRTALRIEEILRFEVNDILALGIQPDVDIPVVISSINYLIIFDAVRLIGKIIRKCIVVCLQLLKIHEVLCPVTHIGRNISIAVHVYLIMFRIVQIELHLIRRISELVIFRDLSVELIVRRNDHV